MKKVLLLSTILAIAMSSCVTMSKYGVYTSFADFRPYLEKGFFISTYSETPYACNFVGHIESIVLSGEDLSFGGKKTSLAGPVRGEFRAATTEDAIEAVYQQAIKAGADGVIDLKFSYATDQYGNVTSTTARGIAIKKK